MKREHLCRHVLFALQRPFAFINSQGNFQSGELFLLFPLLVLAYVFLFFVSPICAYFIVFLFGRFYGTNEFQEVFINLSFGCFSLRLSCFILFLHLILLYDLALYLEHGHNRKYRACEERDRERGREKKNTKECKKREIKYGV